MKNSMTTTAKLLGAAAFAAAALHQAPASAAVINGDFSDATKFTNIAGDSNPIALTTHATVDQGWFGVLDANNRKWEQTGGVANFSPNGKSGSGIRGGALYQVINDGKSTTGAQFFSFDVDHGGSNSSANDVLVYLLGWNVGDTAPSSRNNTSINNSGVDADVMVLGDATPLITTAGVNSEGGFMALLNGAAQNGQTQIVANDGFNPVSLTANFGTGYDFIGIVIQGGTRNGGFLNIDNVAITPVPEPGSLALLALGGLCMLRRRRSS